MHSIFVDFITLDFSAVGKIIHLDNLPIKDLVFSLGILLYYPARSSNATECISPPSYSSSIYFTGSTNICVISAIETAINWLYFHYFGNRQYWYMSLQSLFELGSMTSAGTSIQTLKKSILRSQAEKVSWCLSALKCNSVLDSNEAFQA